MASKTRRAAALVKAEKERSQEKEEEVKVKEEIVEEEDEDAPPPILEREMSCGENDDTDGDAKEEDNSSTEERPVEEEEYGIAGNIMEALAGVFAADNGSPSLKKRRINPSQESLIKSLGARGAISKSLLSTSKNVRPVSSSSKLAALSHITTLRSITPVAGPSTSGTRKYGVPPPIPASLRAAAALGPTVGVGSNRSLGPARLLENRKRLLERDGIVGKRMGSLVAYNGGRAGENFTKKTSTPGSSNTAGTSTSSPTTAFDVHSMLRDQSPVRMQVSVGADHEHSNEDATQDGLEFAALQKESMAKIAQKSTNHSLLLGSIVLNGLNVLHTKNTADYKKFAGELFALVSKYDIT